MQELIGTQILDAWDDKDMVRGNSAGATSTKQTARVLLLPILLCDTLSR
jgi:hypothetical protein